LSVSFIGALRKKQQKFDQHEDIVDIWFCDSGVVLDVLLSRFLQIQKFVYSLRAKSFRNLKNLLP